MRSIYVYIYIYIYIYIYYTHTHTYKHTYTHTQERMGLVTRTLLEASTDLFHFIVLFFLIFIGYASVGNILFGHQVEALSTFPTSCMTLTIILLNFDPAQFYANLAHASIAWALQLFLWSYLVIVFFILLSVSYIHCECTCVYMYMSCIWVFILLNVSYIHSMYVNARVCICTYM